MYIKDYISFLLFYKFQLCWKQLLPLLIAQFKSNFVHSWQIYFSIILRCDFDIGMALLNFTTLINSIAHCALVPLKMGHIMIYYLHSGKLNFPKIFNSNRVATEINPR